MTTDKMREALEFFTAHSKWLGDQWSMTPEGRAYKGEFDRHVSALASAPSPQAPVAYFYRFHTDDSLAGKPNMRSWTLAEGVPPKGAYESGEVRLLVDESPQAQADEPCAECPTPSLSVARAAISLTLTGKQVLDLAEFVVPDWITVRQEPSPIIFDELETEVTVSKAADGHEGPGIYAHITDMPEEGAILLGATVMKGPAAS